MRWSVGFKRMKPGYRFETGWYDHFQVIAVSSGRVIFRVHERDIPVKEGGLLVLRPGSAFILRCEGRGYQGVGVNVHDDPAWCRPGDSLTLSADGLSRTLVALVEHELIDGGQGELLQHLAFALCASALRLSALPAPSMGREEIRSYWAERVRLRLDAHLGTQEPPARILAGLGLGYRQLSRHFQAVTGLTPKAYQLRQRIERARDLLAGGAGSVLGVAVELGFPSSQHFAAVFRRAVGISPRTFRERSAQTDPDASAGAACPPRSEVAAR